MAIGRMPPLASEGWLFLNKRAPGGHALETSSLEMPIDWFNQILPIGTEFLGNHRGFDRLVAELVLFSDEFEEEV